MQTLSITHLVFGLYSVHRTYGGLHVRETSVYSVGVSDISIRNCGQAADIVFRMVEIAFGLLDSYFVILPHLFQRFGFRQVIPCYKCKTFIRRKQHPPQAFAILNLHK